MLTTASLLSRWPELLAAGKGRFILKYGIARIGLLIALGLLLATAVSSQGLPTGKQSAVAVIVAMAAGAAWSVVKWEQLKRLSPRRNVDE